MLSRRNLLYGVSAGGLSWAIAPWASASSARALSLRELLQRSRHAVLGTPTEARALWESVAGARRIVTYTRVTVEQPLDGRPPQSQEWEVRTLGGKVGHIGQVVHGEARLQLARPSLLFVDTDLNAVWRVTGMAQGHYPLKADSQGVSRLSLSPDLPDLTRVDEAAVRLLPGRTVLEAEHLFAAELGQKK